MFLILDLAALVAVRTEYLSGFLPSFTVKGNSFPLPNAVYVDGKEQKASLHNPRVKLNAR